MAEDVHSCLSSMETGETEYREMSYANRRWSRLAIFSERSVSFLIMIIIVLQFVNFNVLDTLILLIVINLKPRISQNKKSNLIRVSIFLNITMANS